MMIFGVVSVVALLTQLLNGLALGMVLTLIATGLTLVFGLMGVVNFAHGAFYMLGAYFGLSLALWTGNFWLALLLAPLAVGAASWLVERGGLRLLYERPPLYQLLFTFGVALIIENLIEMAWGSDVHRIATPDVFRGAAQLFGVYYPKYRLFVLAISVALVLLIWLFLRRSRFGLIVRAGAQDAEMVDGLGINVSRTFTIVFVLGSMLAALAGVIVGPMYGVELAMGGKVIINAFIVVVIGGVGSFAGALAGGLILGLAQVLGVLFFPSQADAAIYAVVVLILLFRPTGLFGEAQLQ